jgi:hypothetical protein
VGARAGNIDRLANPGNIPLELIKVRVGSSERNTPNDI